MNLAEVKDVVRSHFANTGFPTAFLNLALAQGRQMIEAETNFWWMEEESTFALNLGQDEYTIGGDVSDDIVIPLFKDAAFLHFKKNELLTWDEVPIGVEDKGELDLRYANDDHGEPEVAFIKNKSMFIYPPNPDDNYEMHFFYWQWTSNPTSNPATDDLLTFFPMALCYGAIAWGYESQLKDMQGATYWKTLLGGQPYGHGGELARMKRENFKRGWKDKVSLVPRGGPATNNKRRLGNMQIYR